jgi:hypothetical protein
MSGNARRLGVKTAQSTSDRVDHGALDLVHDLRR